MKLRATNPTTNGLEKSFLAFSYSAGATSLDVRNDDRFIVGQKLLVGEMGYERSEIVTVQTVTTPGTSFTIASPGFAFPHEADTPVYVLKFDKVAYYRSTTGVDGTYNQMSTDQPMDVDNLEKETVYDDVNGLSTYFYKVSFKGTYDTSESDLSDPIPGSGFATNTTGELIDEFFQEVGDVQQQNMTVGEALNLMNEVNNDLTSQSRRPYRFLKTSAPLNTTALAPRVALPTNMLKFDRLSFINAYQQRVDDYRRISMEEMEYINFDTSFYPSNDLLYVSIDETTNELVLFPTPQNTATGSIKIYYWKKFNKITSLTNVVETPNTRIYKMFLMGRYYRKRAIKEPNYLTLSDRYLSDYNTEIVKLQRMNRLDMGTPMSLKPDTRTSNGLRR